MLEDINNPRIVDKNDLNEKELSESEDERYSLCDTNP